MWCHEASNNLGGPYSQEPAISTATSQRRLPTEGIYRIRFLFFMLPAECCRWIITMDDASGSATLESPRERFATLAHTRFFIARLGKRRENPR